MNHVPDWDRDYREGKWDGLRDLDQQMRYAILAGCILGHDHEAPKLVLDLGCGIGILREYLPSGSIDRYTGVDLSVEAVEQARLHGHERSGFVAVSVDDWEPDGDYDAIVFNEVLYYLPRPVALVERYARSLRSGGSIFVSMWYPSVSISVLRPTRGTNVRARFGYSRIWRTLSRQFEIVNDIVVRQHGVRKWRIQQLR